MKSPKLSQGRNSGRLTRSRTRAWKIIAVDDHPLVCAALATLLNAQPDMTVSAEAGDAEAAMSILARIRPDLILLDYSLPGRSGIEFIKDVRAFDPHVKIMVLSMHDENHYAERALRAGAAGYIMKTVGSDTLLTAIRQVLAGGVYLSPELSSRIIGKLAGPLPNDTKSSVSQLTDREFEVFLRFGDGSDAAEIAQHLRISRKTVDVHRANIKKKLGLSTSSALICEAVQWSAAEMTNRGG
jgi:DNA-binding NarL/FixJ family response regulator